MEKQELVNYLGDCPNTPNLTLGGKVFWENIKENSKYKLQTNVFTGLARILDTNNKRLAWGLKEAMEEKFRRLSRDDFFEKGDIIGISRVLFEHYGIYVGNNEVIHFSTENLDRNIAFSASKIKIIKTSLEDFVRKAENVFVLHFDNKLKYPIKIRKDTKFTSNSATESVIDIKKSKDYKLYTAEETCERAYQIYEQGIGKYNLIFNNCEHFAIWCKTGVKESLQVRKFFVNISELLTVASTIESLLV